MKHLFIPYELAIIAKEKGFDEHCFAFFNHLKEPNSFEQDLNENFTTYKHSEIKSEIICSPIHQQ